MRHRQRKPKRMPDQHICCRHVGSAPLFTARSWGWIVTALLVGHGIASLLVSAAVDPLRVVLLGMTCHLPWVSCVVRNGGPLL